MRTSPCLPDELCSGTPCLFFYFLFFVAFVHTALGAVGTKSSSTTGTLMCNRLLNHKLVPLLLSHPPPPLYTTPLSVHPITMSQPPSRPSKFQSRSEAATAVGGITRTRLLCPRTRRCDRRVPASQPLPESFARALLWSAARTATSEHNIVPAEGQVLPAGGQAAGSAHIDIYSLGAAPGFWIGRP